MSVFDIHFICRECGTPCDPHAAGERGGLCARCAFPTRVTVKTFQLAIDREAEVSRALEHTAQTVDNVVRFQPDPFRAAIDRAAAAWANDNPKDPT